MKTFTGIEFIPNPSSSSLKQKLQQYCDNTEFDLFVLVNSLPSQKPDFLLNKLASELDIKANQQYRLGDNCSSVIDALNIICNHSSLESNHALLMLYDNLADYISKESLIKKPGFADWRCAASIIVFSPLGKLRLTIMGSSYVRDNTFHNHFSFDMDRSTILVDDSINEKFKSVDLSNELISIDLVLNKTNCSLSSIDAIVVTNRESDRTDRLKTALNIAGNKIISSRSEIGHTGGSDIIYNLSKALESIPKSNIRVLISANGLGYTWACSIIEIERV